MEFNYKKEVKFIVSNKSDLATQKTNAFLESLDQKGSCINRITPLMAYSGTTLMVGCMIDYSYLVREEECQPNE